MIQLSILIFNEDKCHPTKNSNNNKKLISFSKFKAQSKKKKKKKKLMMICIVSTNKISLFFRSNELKNN